MSNENDPGKTILRRVLLGAALGFVVAKSQGKNNEQAVEGAIQLALAGGASGVVKAIFNKDKPSHA